MFKERSIERRFDRPKSPLYGDRGIKKGSLEKGAGIAHGKNKDLIH
jgi:hypothetical protein